MTESERNLGRRWFGEVWNRGRREAITEMPAPDTVLHEAGVDTVFFDRVNAAFSGLHADVQDTFSEDEKVCVRWLFTGTHTGNGLGIDPTGANVHVTGISILRVSGGPIVEGWQNRDTLGMMEQIKGLGRSATCIGR
jgi:predicted ester cyclase